MAGYEIFSVMGTIGLDTSAFERGLISAEQRIRNFVQVTEPNIALGSVTAGVKAAALIAIIADIFSTVDTAVDWIGQIISRIGNANGEVEDLKGSTQHLMDSIQASTKVFDERVRDIEVDAMVARHAAGRIAELGIDQRAELLKYTNLLAGAMPEMARYINAETGLFILNNEEIERNIGLLKRREQTVAAEDILLERQRQQQYFQRRIDELQAEQAEIWTRKVQTDDKMSFGLTDEDGKRFAVVTRDLQKYRSMNLEVAASIDYVSGIIKDNHIQMAESATKFADENEIATRRIEAAVLRVSDSQRKALADMAVMYQRVSDIATDAFRRVSDEVSLSLEEKRDNLLANAEMTRNWGNNISTVMQEAMRRGVDEGVLAKLEEMMNRGPGYAQMMADDLEFVFGELAPAMEDAARAVIDKITTVFGTDTSVAYSVKKLMRDTGKTLEEAVEAMGLEDVGADVVRSLVLGIKSESREAALAAQHVANLVALSTKEAFEMRSPSRVFMDIGRDTVKGLTIGIEGMAGEASDTAAEIAGDMTGAMSDGIYNVSVIERLADVVKMFYTRFNEILEIVTNVFREISRYAQEIVRRMMSGIDQFLRVEGFNTGRNFKVNKGQCPKK